MNKIRCTYIKKKRLLTISNSETGPILLISIFVWTTVGYPVNKTNWDMYLLSNLIYFPFNYLTQ